MMEIGKDIIVEVQKQQLIWFGHTNRMDEIRWPRKVLEWVPQEKRKQGQLRQEWRDYIKEVMEAMDLGGDYYRRKK
jgi:hypothetical protein